MTETADVNLYQQQYGENGQYNERQLFLKHGTLRGVMLSQSYKPPMLS